MLDYRRYALIVCCLVSFLGCGDTSQPVDDAPFRMAIGKYLKANNMGMTIKEIKQGPVISDGKAELRASMTREQVGGPAVTWDFEFEKQTDGQWRVIQHQD